MPQQTLEIDTIALVDQTINDFFEHSITHATLIDSSYRQLWETLYGLIRSGGKRLRPQITVLAYEAFGGTDKSAIISVAAAQELLHFCLLIHDDIIDRDYIRRGVPNVAGQYQALYANLIPDSSERNHYANSAAILGGDLMLSGAYQLIASSTFSDEDKLTAQALMSRSIFEVAGGELLDTESSFAPYSEGDSLKIAQYKTASYSFIAPLLTGATLAGVDEDQIKLLRSFGLSLGIAFQLADDILGVFGAEEVTGKSVSSDIREGKRTYMIEKATAAMTHEEKVQFDLVFGKPTITLEAIAQVRALLISTKARQKTEEAIRYYAQEARNTLSLLSLEDEYPTKFERLIHKMTERSF